MTAVRILPLIVVSLLTLASAAERTFILECRMTGFIGKEGAIEGKKNPTLEVAAGDQVTIVIVNAEPMAHDLVLDTHQVKSKQLLKIGDKTSVTFVAKASEAYYCSIPGHRQIGMVGQLQVAGGS